jgi:hypothetical protein
VLDRVAHLRCLKTPRGHCIPPGTETFPLKFLCGPPNWRTTAMTLLPLIDPITSATAYFGGIRLSMWTWSCTICPSMMVLPRCRASSRNTGPRNFRILPYSSFFRPFGIKTTWYLPSHFAWLRLSYDDVVIPYAPCGPPSPQ